MQYQLKWIYCSLLLMGFTNCANQKEIRGDQEPEIIFTWTKTPCLGTCPVFHMTIDELGNVDFDGRAHVPKEGMVETKIAEIELNHLIDLVDVIEFSELESRYDDGVMDVSTSSITCRDSKVQCTGQSPLAFEILERELELLAVKYKLLSRNRTIRPQPVDRTLIMEGKDNLSYARVILDQPNLGLELIRKLSLSKPLFLLTFDRNQTVEDVLVALDDHREIINVEKNKTLKRRDR